MRFLPFIVKHLRRSWVRTLSTVMAMAVSIFLFCTLQTALAEVYSILETARDWRLVTRNAVSILFPLPLAYGDRIASLPGVKRVATVAWFAGSLPEKRETKADDTSGSGGEWSRFVPSMAVDATPFFAMYPEYEVSPGEWQAFLADLRGCVIGKKLAEKFGWKLGDTFYLESAMPSYQRREGPTEFVVRAIYDLDAARHPGSAANVMFFHYKHLYEATGRRIGAGGYFVEIADEHEAAAVGRAIDALFENSGAETRTEAESAFRAGWIAKRGNLPLLLNGIGLAAAFTMLLVTANTMSMALRERRTEIAVLKTLGFSGGRVMALILGEALLLGVAGGAVGVGGTQAALWIVSGVPAMKEVLAGFRLSGLALRPWVGALGFGAALVLGLAAGFLPARAAYRSRITDILRAV
jgi:putative ABC transport system permease protein